MAKPQIRVPNTSAQPQVARKRIIPRILQQPTQQKKKGRPSGSGFQVNEELREFIQIGCATGVPHDTLCALAVHAKLTQGQTFTSTQLIRHFAHEAKHGLEQANATAKGQLFRLIREGHPSAIFFWLKTKGGWRENVGVEVTGAGGGPVQFEMTAEERATKILQALAVARAQKLRSASAE